MGTQSNWQSFFEASLAEAEAAALRRGRTAHFETQDCELQKRDGHCLVNFGSNDYLGLRHDPRVAAAVAKKLSTWGTGAGASPLVSGYSSELAELEQQLAAWQGTEAALVFANGFAMNVGVIAALVGPGDLVFSDALNHASLIDGCRLSGAHKIVYPHADASAVENLLRSERHRYRRAVLITESVFSMDGDVAPLEALCEICQRHDVGLIVDEAHATGALGATGGGLSELLSVTDEWLAKLGTLSKAIGTCGGFVCGSRALIEFLVNRCRSYIYSTAIAPPVVSASLAAIELIPQLGDRRGRLQELNQRVRTELEQQGWQVAAGTTPIVPVIVGPSELALDISRQLSAAGLFVPAIRPPTVPVGTARLRISLSSAHTDDQIEKLLSEFARLVKLQKFSGTETVPPKEGEIQSV